MNMKKISKIVSFIIILMTVLSVATTVSAAISADSTTLDANQITGKGSTVKVGKVGTIANDIVSVLTAGGIAISVIVLIVLGIKYMMGSVEEKAEYKKTLMPYIIGAGLVFAASVIASAVVTFMSGLGGNT